MLVAEASRYFLKAIQIGPPFIVYCSIRQCLRALYIEEGISSEFTIAWTKHEEWSADDIESRETKKRRLQLAVWDKSM